MAVGDVPPADNPSLSDDAERKLWFDYLARLNDRELQSAQASGFTPWALMAVLAATVYGAAPKITAFVSTPGAVKKSFITLLLEADFLSHAGFFALILAFYCSPRSSSRLVPEHDRRVASISILMGRIFVAVLAAGHLIAAAYFDGRASTRIIWAVGGGWWIYNLLSGARTDFKGSAEAKRLGLPKILLRPNRQAALVGSPLGAAFVLVIAAVPFTALVLFLRSLPGGGISWVTALGAATEVLLVGGTLAVLFGMCIQSASRGVFLALERDILVENLSAAQIKIRFIRDALGPSVADWIEAARLKHQEALQALLGTCDSISKKAPEIEGIDPQYALERTGRARKALAGCGKTLFGEIAKKKIAPGCPRIDLEVWGDGFLSPNDTISPSISSFSAAC